VNINNNIVQLDWDALAAAYDPSDPLDLANDPVEARLKAVGGDEGALAPPPPPRVKVLGVVPEQPQPKVIKALPPATALVNRLQEELAEAEAEYEKAKRR